MSGNCGAWELQHGRVMFEGHGVWGFWWVGVSVYPTIYRESWGLGGMVISYLLERFQRFIKHKLREMEAAKRKNRKEMTQKEEEKNEKMDELVDIVVDAAKARVLEALREGEEQDEMGKDVDGKEDALIGLN